MALVVAGPITKQTLHSQRQNTNKMSFLKIAIMLVFVVLLHAQAASAQDDDTCRHKRFNQCRCEQYAEILKESERTEYEQAGIPVYKRTDLALTSTSKKL